MFQLIGEAKLIHHQTAGLVAEYAVHAGDGLHEAVAALLIPVNAAQRLELLTGDYLQADETPVGVPSPAAPKGQNHRACQWQYSVPGAPLAEKRKRSR